MFFLSVPWCATLHPKVSLETEASPVAGGTGNPLYITKVPNTLKSPERERPEKEEPLRDGCEES